MTEPTKTKTKSKNDSSMRVVYADSMVEVSASRSRRVATIRVNVDCGSKQNLNVSCSDQETQCKSKGTITSSTDIEEQEQHGKTDGNEQKTLVVDVSKTNSKPKVIPSNDFNPLSHLTPSVDQNLSAKLCRKTADFEFHCNGQVIPVNRLVVVHKSRRLRDQLLKDTLQTQRSVTVDRVCPEALRTVVQWMYDNQIDITEDNVLDIWLVAKELEIQDLMKICLERLHSIHPMLVYRLALQRGIPELAAEALHFMARNFMPIIRRMDFIDFNMEEVHTLLSCDILSATGEMDVYLAAVKWLTADWTNRKSHLVKIMRCVRFIHLNTEQIELLLNPAWFQRTDKGVNADALVLDELHKALIYKGYVQENKAAYFEYIVPPKRKFIERTWDMTPTGSGHQSPKRQTKNDSNAKCLEWCADSCHLLHIDWSRMVNVGSSDLTTAEKQPSSVPLYNRCIRRPSMDSDTDWENSNSTIDSKENEETSRSSRTSDEKYKDQSSISTDNPNVLNVWRNGYQTNDSSTRSSTMTDSDSQDDDSTTTEDITTGDQFTSGSCDPVRDEIDPTMITMDVTYTCERCTCIDGHFHTVKRRIRRCVPSRQQRNNNRNNVKVGSSSSWWSNPTLSLPRSNSGNKDLLQ